MNAIEIETPYDNTVHTEKTVLGGILVEPDSVFEATSHLDPADFSLSSHRVIYGAILRVVEDRRPVDIVTVLEELGKDAQIVGGVAYLASLSEGLPRKLNIASYVHIVKDKANMRQLKKLCSHALESAERSDRDAGEIIADLEVQFMDIVAEGSQVRSFREIGPVVIAKMRERATTQTEINSVMGLTTTIPELDRATMGLQMGEMSLVGGYNADGKTSFAMQVLAINAARGIPGVLFSHESHQESAYKRVMSIATEIPFAIIKDPQLLKDPSMFDDVQDWTSMERQAGFVSSLPIFVDDDSKMQIAKIRATIRVLAKKHGVKLAVIDFIQKGKAPGDGPRERINNFSEQLREVAKEENIHIMALSQIGQPDRKVKARPTMWQFRESQGPVDDAHLALAVYRPLDDDGGFSGQDEILILKQREGMMNVTVKVKFNNQLMKYESPNLQSYYDNR